MSQNLVVISVFPDRLEVSRTPTVRAKVEPLQVVVHWRDDGIWEELHVGAFVRIDRSHVETVPPDPLFKHQGTDPAQDVNFKHLEREDIGATYQVVAAASTKKYRLEETFHCWLQGFDSGKSKTI